VGTDEEWVLDKGFTFEVEGCHVLCCTHARLLISRMDCPGVRWVCQGGKIYLEDRSWKLEDRILI